MVHVGNYCDVAKAGQVHGHADDSYGGCDIGEPGHYPVPAVVRVDPGNFVANIKSQIKRNRQNEKRHTRNKAVRSELKTRVKRAITAAEQGEENAADAAKAAIKRLDKAATKGIIHKNAAARRKSRLQKRINKASAQA
jgi:small subunit ribosomal protein S20